jgi:hypothetical protein
MRTSKENFMEYRWKSIPVITGTVIALFFAGCVDKPSEPNRSDYAPCTDSTHGYFRISYPFPGQSIRMGTIDSIVWSTDTSKAPGNVSLYLCKDRRIVQPIIINAINHNAYTWTLPAAGTGSGYRIKIQSCKDTAKFDLSCSFGLYSDFSGNYAITAAPGSGDHASGDTLQIRWQSTGTPGNKISLRLCIDSIPFSVITTKSDNSGAYLWCIPQGLMTKSDYRIKIASYYDLGLSAVSEAISISGIDPDSYEPDNKPDSASLLNPLGTPQFHNLSIGDTDWVNFSADSGFKYVVQITGMTSASILSFDSGIMKYRSGIISSSISPVLWKCDKTAFYYLKLFAPENWAGNYAVNLIRFDSSSIVKFHNPTAAAVWDAGSPNRVEWLPDSSLFGANISISLIDNSREFYSMSGIQFSEGEYLLNIPSGLSTGRNYRIRLTSNSDTALCGYSAFFTIHGIDPDAYEPDNSKDSAVTFSPLGQAQYHTLMIDDTDWVSFNADSGGEYLFQCRGALSIRGALFQSNSNDEIMAFSGDTGIVASLQRWICPKTDVWFMRFTGSSIDSGGAYLFNVSRCDSFSPISFMSPLSTSNVTAGASFRIQWSSYPATSGTGMELRLYKGVNPVGRLDSIDNKGFYDWSVPAGAASGHDYRVRVDIYSSIALCGYSPIFSISGIDQDAYEPDDSIAFRHTIMTTGIPENHTLTWNDIDWFEFTMAANSFYVIKTTGATRSISTQFELYSLDGTIMTGSAVSKILTGSAASSASDSSATLTLYCGKEGATHYYFKTKSDTTGAYQVLVDGFDSTEFGFSVTFPKAGDSYTAGQTFPVCWSSVKAIYDSVQIGLFSGNEASAIAEAKIANSGIYSFRIPVTVTAGDDYFIKVFSRLTTKFFGESGKFSIKAK